ncbi:hypothetical protein ACIBG8_02565 [Nonomuraea sp. NPDC050556]|uniref:hypothetical protein n=1 Tax=Nonomuraea sp. NPDC050556 TaxID=3364369 RepID=UPI0037AF6044
MSDELAERLRQVREAPGRSLRELERAIHVSSSSLSAESHAVMRARTGHTLLQLGRFAQARDAATEAVEAARDIGDRHLEAIGLRVLGAVALGEGDAAGAMDLFRTALAHARATGYRMAEALSLTDVAEAARAQGRGERPRAIPILIPYGETCLVAGDRDEAIRRLHEALDLATALGLRHWRSEALRLLGTADPEVCVPPGTHLGQLSVSV